MADIDILIERWRAGEQRAAEMIYDLHRDRTFRLAYALLDNREDAEEVAQDALAYALVNINQFDDRRSKFTTWLHMITVSRSRDKLRKRRLPTFSLYEWLKNRQQKPDPQPDPELLMEKSETQDQVWRAIQQLSPVLREAVVLRHWGGHTYQDIGEIIGCPMKTAQSRVRLAHKSLANDLSEIDIQEKVKEVPS
jgi:RNA polymerase sigma-70 factor (ECF subfamily)